MGGDVLVDLFTHVGDFTVAPDLRGQRRLYVRVEVFDPLRENMIFYLVLVGILCIGATGLLFFGSLDASSLSAYGIVVANAWGISTGILLVVRFSRSAASVV